MPLLLAGFAAVFAGLLGWGIGAGYGWLQYESQSIPRLIAAILLAPTLAAWAGAELVNMLSPRRLFDRRRNTRLSRLALGVAAALVSAAAGAAALPLVDRQAPDAAVFGASGFLVMAAFVLGCSRVRAGRCIHCGYDLRRSPAPGQPGAGRCPECGASIVPEPVRSAPASAVP